MTSRRFHLSDNDSSDDERGGEAHASAENDDGDEVSITLHHQVLRNSRWQMHSIGPARVDPPNEDQERQASDADQRAAQRVNAAGNAAGRSAPTFTMDSLQQAAVAASMVAASAAARRVVGTPAGRSAELAGSSSAFNPTITPTVSGAAAQSMHDAALQYAPSAAVPRTQHVASAEPQNPARKGAQARASSASARMAPAAASDASAPLPVREMRSHATSKQHTKAEWDAALQEAKVKGTSIRFTVCLAHPRIA